MCLDLVVLQAIAAPTPYFFPRIPIPAENDGPCSPQFRASCPKVSSRVCQFQKPAAEECQRCFR